MCSGACHRYAAGRILPSCPHPAGHLGRKKCFIVLKFAVDDYCHICLRQKTRSVARRQQEKASRKLLKHPRFSYGGKQRHNPTPNPGGQLPGSGKHLCWGKGTTGNLHACSVKEEKKHPTHKTTFQE